jgi:predicted short-subunit dehydrogenase-like oxidoreductase (DUF2520 family)
LKPVLHIAGCGRVGRSLARLWHQHGVFEIGWVLNRSLASAESAVDFIGAGVPAAEPAALSADDWLMLAAPDGALEALVDRLAGALSRSPALAFHVSGAEPAELLRPLDALLASVHPVCPFSDPERAVGDFAGSHALGEGDVEALDRLLPAFEAIGAVASRFRPTDKRCYHAAAIAASNFLNVLDDLALRLAEAGGLERELALPVLVSLQRIALDSIEQVGPASSLTGPIERGDAATCGRLAEVLRKAPGDEERTLLSLARSTVRVAERKRGARDSDADPLLELFRDRRGSRGEGDAGV